MMKRKALQFIQDILPINIFLCSIIFACCALFKGWYGCLSDFHGFRQTQTAITVRYLLEGGPWLAYETPILGPPWSIPMEFPLYQWLVALAAKTGFFPLDQAGRFISVAFFLLCLCPFYGILKRLGCRKNQIFLILSLYCISPLYIFWSRTFMIESLALALSLYYLWLVFYFSQSNFQNYQKWLVAGSIAMLGSLAAMVKITTFFSFAVIGAAVILWPFLKQVIQQKSFSQVRLLHVLQGLIFSAFLPLAALLLWTAYCDSLKSLNPLARDFITSAALKEWNFGTLAQRLSTETWAVFFDRISEILGSSWGVVLVIVAGILCRRERFGMALVCLALFIFAFATFTNLHLVHYYYPYANGIFLIAAVGIICSELWMNGDGIRITLGILLFFMIAYYSISHYMESYWPRQGRTVNIAQMKSATDKFMGRDDIIVVLGHDWSSELPYYLGRRAVMIRSNDIQYFNSPLFKEVKNNTKGYTIGAILFCGRTRSNSVLISTALREFDFKAASPGYGMNHFITVYYKSYPQANK